MFDQLSRPRMRDSCAPSVEAIPGRRVTSCSHIEGDAGELRNAVQGAFGLSPIAVDAVLAMQVRRFTPEERHNRTSAPCASSPCTNLTAPHASANSRCRAPNPRDRPRTRHARESTLGSSPGRRPSRNRVHDTEGAMWLSEEAAPSCRGAHCSTSSSPPSARGTGTRRTRRPSLRS